LPQYQGHNFKHETWEKRLRTQDRFPPSPAQGFPNAPDQIISEFQAGHYLPALDFTVSWGLMWRTNRYIYGNTLEYIDSTLGACALSIRETSSIQHSWELLTGNRPGLQWSSVISSKVLHFFCRALGFDQRPPVPIDNEVMRRHVWPTFIGRVPWERRPRNWLGDDFDSYCRYMTVIITWADQRHWTTTQMEPTIFAEYRRGLA
jgi:hypothetical protein